MRVHRVVMVIAVLLVLGAWDPFRAPDADVEAGNRAVAEGRWDDALAAYDRAARRGGVDRDGLAFDRGSAELGKARAMKDPAERASMTARAIEDLREAERAADPKLSAAASYNRGNALLGEDKLDDAIEAYKKALRARPDLEDARVNLELALRRRGNKEQQRKQQGQGQGQGQQGQGQQGQGQQGQGQQGQGQQGQGQNQQGQGQQGQGQGQQGQGQQGSGTGSGSAAGTGTGSATGSGSAAGSGSGSAAGTGSASPQDGSAGQGQGSDQNGSDAGQRGQPGGSAGAPGHDPRGRPGHGHGQGRGPDGATDRKLDDLEDLSRRLRRQDARRHATGRATDPERDW